MNSAANKRAKAGVETFAQTLVQLSQKHYERDGSELLRGLKDDDLARKQMRGCSA